MANTYSSIYLHLVFAVKNRDAMLAPHFRERIYQYISRTIEEIGHTTIAIGGTDNHIHILIRYNINLLIPDLVRDIKTNSSKFINVTFIQNGHFEWQRGYGIFSHSFRDLEVVKQYILNQPQHHLNMTIEQELKLMLERCNIAMMRNICLLMFSKIVSQLRSS